jgi:hypothetical protein
MSAKTSINSLNSKLYEAIIGEKSPTSSMTMTDDANTDDGDDVKSFSDRLSVDSTALMSPPEAKSNIIRSRIGKNIILFDGSVVLGPSVVVPILTNLILVIITVLVIFEVQELTAPEEQLCIAISVMLFTIDIVLFILTIVVEPGIIPREENSLIPSKAEDNLKIDIKIQTNYSSLPGSTGNSYDPKKIICSKSVGTRFFLKSFTLTSDDYLLLVILESPVEPAIVNFVTIASHDMIITVFGSELV